MPRILGLDYGTRRIGMAISDESEIIAMPLDVIQVKNQRQVISDLQQVCADKNVEKILVGMPFNMDGTKGESAERVMLFVKQIVEQISLPIELWDERLSSKSAERLLIESGVRRSRRKEVIDKLAAQIVLQSYLDAKV